MSKFKTLDDMPEQLEDNHVLIYSNGVLKSIEIPAFGELILKTNDGKLAYASVTEKGKF